MKKFICCCNNNSRTTQNQDQSNRYSIEHYKDGKITINTDCCQEEKKIQNTFAISQDFENNNQNQENISTDFQTILYAQRNQEQIDNQGEPMNNQKNEQQNQQVLQPSHNFQEQQIKMTNSHQNNRQICSKQLSQNTQNHQSNLNKNVQSCRNSQQEQDQTEHPDTYPYQNIIPQNVDHNQTYIFNNQNELHKTMTKSKLSNFSTQDVVLNIQIDQVAYNILKNGCKITEIPNTPIECLKNLNHDFLIINFTFNEFKLKLYASISATQISHIQYSFFNDDEDELVFFIVNTTFKKEQNPESLI
ncbi:hypothetical protein ABPG72_018810 [Tetrahymena utriculariae]